LVKKGRIGFEECRIMRFSGGKADRRFQIRGRRDRQPDMRTVVRKSVGGWVD
jgi:hypothetical protein